MIKGIEAVLLSSENAKALAKFYEEKVGLKVGEEMEIGHRGELAFEVSFGSGSNLYILDHSEVKGKSKQPQRVMFNLEAGDIEKEVARLKKNGVKLVADIYHVENYGLIATFEDIDGNYFQLVQVRAS